jgi:hypothetical protein
VEREWSLHIHHSTSRRLINYCRCTLQAERAKELGWRAEYPPEYILEAADAEVGLILKD